MNFPITEFVCASCFMGASATPRETHCDPQGGRDPQFENRWLRPNVNQTTLAIALSTNLQSLPGREYLLAATFSVGNARPLHAAYAALQGPRSAPVGNDQNSQACHFKGLF